MILMDDHDKHSCLREQVDPQVSVGGLCEIQ